MLHFLVSHKTIDPGRVSFLFGFSFHNIMFLTYIKFERNLLLRKNHVTVACPNGAVSSYELHNYVLKRT